MIVIDVGLDESGLLKSCRASGHAGAGERGTDIVCAAVSILTKTAFQTLEKREGIEVRGGALDRGVFLMETRAAEGEKPFLSAIGSFLLEGLNSVSREYPGHCTVNINTGFCK